MRLYEDASLRGDLTDEPADRLLKWAEDKLIALDESGLDDVAFEAGVESILASVQQINRNVGQTLSANDAAEFGALSVVPDEMALVETLIARFDNPEVDAQALSASDALPDSAVPEAPIPPEDLPTLNIELNPALTSFFTGQPAPAVPAVEEPAAENVKDAPDESQSPEVPAEVPPLKQLVNSTLARIFGEPTTTDSDAHKDETDDDDAQE